MYQRQTGVELAGFIGTVLGEFPGVRPAPCHLFDTRPVTPVPCPPGGLP